MPIPSKFKLFDIDAYGFLAVVAICGLTFFLVVKPLDAKRHEIIEKQQASDQESNQTQRKIDHLNLMLAKQKQLTQDLAQAKNILLENSGIENVIQELEQLALNNNLILEEITPLEEKNHEQYRTHALSLSLSGQFPDLRGLLFHLHKQLPYVRIEELSMTAQKEGTAETGLGRIHLNLIIFSPRITE